MLIAGACFFWYYRYEYQQRCRAYDTIIHRAARRHCIDYRLLRAVIMQESNFRVNARGTSGEVGLMQVRPDAAGAAQDWAVSRRIPKPCPGLISDPELNIEIGAWYLSRALRHWRKYDDCIPLALCEYNAGWSNANNWKPVVYDGKVLDRITFRSTRAYVEGIMKKYQEQIEPKEPLPHD
ncbi:MAG: lytic transglycosylase domain-containing protein [Victivallales bacterium]|nr:lytic transglycosylase domain-containing protein [Victivallales bacterium]